MSVALFSLFFPKYFYIAGKMDSLHCLAFIMYSIGLIKRPYDRACTMSKKTSYLDFQHF